MSFVEPITVAEVMTHCRITSVDEAESAKISAFISAAREYVESYTGKLYGSRVETAVFKGLYPILPIAKGPVTSVISVIAETEDGPVDVTENYVIDVQTGFELIAKNNLPDLKLSDEFLYPVTVEYNAGLSVMPASIKQACLLIIGHWYENREEVVVSAGNAIQIPLAAKSLLEMRRHSVL